MPHAESLLLPPATRRPLMAARRGLAFAEAPRMVGTVSVFRVSPEFEPAPDDEARPVDPRIDAPASALADTDLALRGCGGERAAMDELVRRHHAAVTRLLWRFARNRSDLEDLVQDTFVRMVRALPEWQPAQPFERWLLRIATNTGRDYFRRQAVRRRWMADTAATDEAGLGTEAVEPSANPAARAAANEVKAVLAQLPPGDRALLTLHHLEGWSLAQIAGQFGWTVTATKLRAWRARQRLRALFPSREFDEYS